MFVAKTFKMASFFKFPINKTTEQEIFDLLNEIKKSDKVKPYSKQISEVINKLIDEGMEYYFINTIKRLKINPIVRKPFILGINTSIKGLKVVSPQIFKTLSEKQFKEAIAILEEMIEIEG